MNGPLCPLFANLRKRKRFLFKKVLFCNNYFNKSIETARHSLKNDSGFALMVFRLISFFKSAQPAIKHGVSESKYFEQIPRRETYIITLISNVN